MKQHKNCKNLSLDYEWLFRVLFLIKRSCYQRGDERQSLQQAKVSVQWITVRSDFAPTQQHHFKIPLALEEQGTLLTGTWCSLMVFALPDMTFKSSRAVPHLLNIIIFSKTFKQLFSLKHLSSPTVNNRTSQMLRFMHVLKCLVKSGLQTLTACWTRVIIPVFTPRALETPLARNVQN